MIFSRFLFSLILNCLSAPYPRRRIASIIQFITKDVLSYLSSSSCGCVYDVDWSSVDQLVNITRTILASRQSVCKLDSSLCNHLSSLLIQVRCSGFEILQYKKMVDIDTI